MNHCTYSHYPIVLNNMNTKLSQIFKNISQREPSTELKGFILRKIEIERAVQIRRKLMFSYVGIGSSFVAGVWAIVGLGSVLIKSEFWSILSLIFSDARVVAGYWNTYLYSLLETLPTISIALTLIPILGIIISAGFYFDLRNKNKQNYHSHFKLA
jgi:hypothetical protein